MANRRQPGSESAPAAFASGSRLPGPRKQPVQDRSRDTVRAILEATFQVLAQGEALSTTRVAEVAGVSVGTLYQYFPNKEALVLGVLAEHLRIGVDAVIAAAEEVAAEPPEVAVGHVVRALLAAKAARAPISRALRPALDGIDERPLVRAATQRAAEALARILARGEPDEALRQRTEVVCAAIEGVVASVIADDPARLGDPALVEQLIGLARGGIG